MSKEQEVARKHVFIKGLEAIDPEEISHILQEEINTGASLSAEILNSIHQSNYFHGQLSLIIAENYQKQGELSKAKLSFLSSIYCYIQKRNFLKAEAAIKRYEDLFSADTDVMIAQLKSLLVQNNNQKLNSFAENYKKKLETNKKKSRNYYEQIRSLNSLFSEARDEMTAVKLIQLVAQLKIHALNLLPETADKKVNAENEKKNILALFHDALVIDPDSLPTYCHLVEVLHYFSDPDLIKVTNYIEREYAAEALQAGGPLAVFLKKYKTKKSNVQVEEVAIDDLLSFDSDDQEIAESGMKISNEREILLSKISELRSQGRSIEALDVISELTRLYPKDPIVKIVRNELLEIDLAPKNKSSEQKEVQGDATNPSFSRILSEDERLLLREVELRVTNLADSIHQIDWQDLVALLFSLELYTCADNFLAPRTEMQGEIADEALSAHLNALYLRICAKYLAKDFTSALGLVEDVNNTLPTNRSEHKCFLYLEAEILIALGKKSEAKRILKELSTISPNYRRVAEKLKALDEVK